MTKRSRAREVAMQLLFVKDFSKNATRASAERFARERLASGPLVPFALELYDGALERMAEIDQGLSASADNWKLHRMAAVDRNILRLGAFEMLFLAEATPVAVALDEAIELARRFGSKDSPSFVNGVLDKFHRSRTEAAAAVVTEPEPEPQPAAVPSDPA